MSLSNNISFKSLIYLLIGLFIFRLTYGLFSEFWFEDELQIYLIGLKSFTTDTWPYYGPDLVYTNTQIQGALQGLLVSESFEIATIPESPTIVLNILTFSSLSLMAFYINKKIQTIPNWLTFSWIMLLTWSMDYGTRVINPGYVLIFSIPFFIAVFEILLFQKKMIFNKYLVLFVLGATPALIMQLHLSFVLTFPFIGLVFLKLFTQRKSILEFTGSFLVFFIGLIIGLSTLIPTLFLDDSVKEVSNNVVFNLDNYKNIFTILTRFFSFASFEVPYILGGDTESRMTILKYSIWMMPSAIFLLLLGFALVGSYIITLFKRGKSEEWKNISIFTIFSFGLIFFSFFFSIKGPSSHTFYIMFPIAVFYSFYVLEFLWVKYSFWKYIMFLSIPFAIVFYVGLGSFNYSNKSLYVNRELIIKALEEKDYKILGERRADKWGYGY